MDIFAFVLISMVFLFFGVNMVANNRLNQFIITHMFYSSSSSSMLVRVLGVAILASFVLFLLQMPFYAAILGLFVMMIFTFFTIQGRAKAKAYEAKRKSDLEALHRAQLAERKKDLAKTRAQKIKDLEKSRDKPQSVADMKKKLWNDGSMTNRDIIRDLKD